MRRSEFERAVESEFGRRASALLVDLALPGLGDLTAAQALAAGIPPRQIWDALCEETDVPSHRRYGAGRLESRRR
jgi:hypothetical protein